MVLVSSKIALPLQTLCICGSHLRWLQIGLHPWLAELAANLPQQRQQQHWQMRHWLLQWQWQCGRGSGGLHPNGQGSRARPGWGRMCAQALPLWLALHACGSGYALAAWALPLRLGFAHTHQLNSKAVAAKAALAVLPLISRSGAAGGSSSGMGCGSGRQHQ